MSGNTFLRDYMKARFGCKVYKIPLNGGMTCPNRDGKIGSRGCIFCSEGGSGEFAAPAYLSIPEQLRIGKENLRPKLKNFDQVKYFPYFQAFTNTYAPADRLRQLYTQALEPEDTVGLSVATRPDELPAPVLALLEELVRDSGKEIWVELGLQTIHERTASYLRRGYDLACFEEALSALNAIGVRVVVHVIFGLPGEHTEDMLATVKYLSEQEIFGIKLQNLQVLKGTDLEQEYLQGRVRMLTMEEYADTVKRSLEILPAHIVIHRVTGDPPGNLLVAPLWCRNKRKVMNACLESKNII